MLHKLCAIFFCKYVKVFLVLSVACLQMGCFRGFVSGKFVLAKDSPLPSWLDKSTIQKCKPFEIKFTVYEPIFTNTGKVTVYVISSNVNNKIVRHGVHRRVEDDLPVRKEGEPSLVLMEINGTVDVYEFLHLRNVIRIVSKNGVTVHQDSAGTNRTVE